MPNLTKPDAPVDNLIRQFEFTPMNSVLRSEDGQPVLVGYAAVFNSVTRIDSWEGKFDEVLLPGAFKKTIAERTPVLQFDHGRHPMIGSLPVGRIRELREDERGLYVEAPLFVSGLTEPLIQAMDELGGMSFRMKYIRDDWEYEGDVPLRKIREVSMPELGPVVFPAYTDTEVGVRSLLTQATPDEVRGALDKFCTSTDAAPSGTSGDAATGAKPHPYSREQRSELLARVRKAAR